VIKLAEAAREHVHSDLIIQITATVKPLTSAKSHARDLKSAKTVKIYVLQYLDMTNSIDVEREIINVLQDVKNLIAYICVSLMLVMIAVIHTIVETNIHAKLNVKTMIVKKHVNTILVSITMCTHVANLSATIIVNSAKENAYFLIIFIQSSLVKKSTLN
jgi:hypothetical protein